MKTLSLLVITALAASALGDDIRVGIIGTDTSHVIAFTRILNDATAKNHIPGCKVVAAFKQGSADIPSSANRVEEYAKELREKYGVEMVPSIEELCKKVDAVLLENVDGRPHLANARPVIAAKKRMFIDKPLAGSLRDALEIARLAKEAEVPVFSASAYRFYPTLVDLKKTDVGDIRGAISFGPMHLEEHHPDFFWYGVHPAEALFTILGRGCESVSRTSTSDTDVAVGVWSGGRTGTLVGLRTKPLPHRVMVFGSTAFAEQKNGGDDYAPLVGEIVKFFQTGIAPVPLDETIEILTFMEAADESKRRGGAPVKLSEVLEKARR